MVPFRSSRSAVVIPNGDESRVRSIFARVQDGTASQPLDQMVDQIDISEFALDLITDFQARCPLRAAAHGLPDASSSPTAFAAAGLHASENRSRTRFVTVRDHGGGSGRSKRDHGVQRQEFELSAPRLTSWLPSAAENGPAARGTSAAVACAGRESIARSSTRHERAAPAFRARSSQRVLRGLREDANRYLARLLATSQSRADLQR